MSISQDMTSALTVLNALSKQLAPENKVLAHMIHANLSALVEQVEALEGIPLDMHVPATVPATDIPLACQ